MENELIILPFDHRSSFVKDILNVEKSSKKDEEKIKELKKIIFEGFMAFASSQKDKPLGILVDEMYGEEIIKEAKEKNIIISIPVEKSGTKEFEFEFNDFEKHIKKFNPDYVKVLFKYSSNDNNINSFKKLYKLGQFCEKNNYKLIFELLIPSKDKRLEETLKAIKELKNFIKVDIWKMEGYSEQEWKEIIKLLNEKEQIIVLGRGEDKQKVENWLKEASKIDKIIGFAIGRTIFLEALKEYYQNKLSKEQAVKKIKTNFEYFVNLWESSNSI